MVTAALLLFGVSRVEAQAISVGVKIGARLTTAYTIKTIPDGIASASEERFTIGPSVDLRLIGKLSVEVDALWRRSSFAENAAYSNAAASVNDWQVPLLAKYSMKRAFIDGGAVYRHVSIGGLSARAPQPSPTSPNTGGVCVGGGITFKVPHVRISPELRYTGWLVRPFSSLYNGPVVGTRNQVDLLVGFAF